MKRIAQRIALFLLIGAVVTVLVAWGIALAVNPYEGESQAAGENASGRAWIVGVVRTRGGVALTSVRQTASENPMLEALKIAREAGLPQFNSEPSSLCPSWSRLDEPLDAYQEQAGYHEARGVEARGWPCIALYCTRDAVIGLDGAAGDGTWKWCYQVPGVQWSVDPGIQGTPPWKREVLLPLRPIWLGFTVNVLFYAILLWAPFGVFGFVCRQQRRNCGLCERCGYPRGTSETCSECGAPIRLAKQ